jgi:RNase P subunit RPR2
MDAYRTSVDKPSGTDILRIIYFARNGIRSLLDVEEQSRIRLLLWIRRKILKNCLFLCHDYRTNRVHFGSR